MESGQLALSAVLGGRPYVLSYCESFSLEDCLGLTNVLSIPVVGLDQVDKDHRGSVDGFRPMGSHLES